LSIKSKSSLPRQKLYKRINCVTHKIKIPKKYFKNEAEAKLKVKQKCKIEARQGKNEARMKLKKGIEACFRSVRVCFRIIEACFKNI